MKSKKHGIYVADDKAGEIATNPFFGDLLVRYGHHHRLSTCLIVQDATMPGSKMKSMLSKNFHVNVMMSSPRDRGYIRNLGILMNDYKCLVDSYDDCCDKPHKYFIIDTHPMSNPQLKYRTQIFPSDDHCIVYQSKKHSK